MMAPPLSLAGGQNQKAENWQVLSEEEKKKEPYLPNLFNTMRMYKMFLMFIILGGTPLLSACGLLKPIARRTVPDQHSHRTAISDTFSLSMVPVDKITGQIPAIGDSLSIPALGMSIHRISQTQALIKTPVRRETRIEKQTLFIPTVDKSRHYTDSYNRTDTNIKDKSQNAPRKIKEVEKTDNSVTRKTHKGLSQWGTTWWIIILIVAGCAAAWYIRQRIKIF